MSDSSTRPWYMHKNISIPLALLTAMIIACGSSTTTGTGNGDGGGSNSSEATEDETKGFTTGQKNAYRSAKNYLSMQGFSRKGLIQQLTSDAGDGYPEADATFAVDHLDVDWKEQAVRSAKTYLDMQGFSRQGLIEQLSSSAGDQYTVEEATYGADKALAEQK